MIEEQPDPQLAARHIRHTTAIRIATNIAEATDMPLTLQDIAEWTRKRLYRFLRRWGFQWSETRVQWV